MSYKICFLIPYFGIEFPDYFPFFLKTVSYNSGIDFMIFTDVDFSSTKSPGKHCHFIKFNLPSFSKLANSILPIDIKVDRPYKLCDFKPAYGLIFQDYIRGYDFWGHCDIDILFGNIQRFITKKKLDSYDIISARKEYLSGFFTLYRNTQRINFLFMNSKDWKLVFSDQENYCFDECNWEFYPCLSGTPIEEIKSEIESMTHVVAKYKNKINTSFDTMCHEFLENEDYFDELEVNANGLFSKNSRKEFLLTHFVQTKKSNLFNCLGICEKTESIYIDRFGVSGKKGLQELRKFHILKLKLVFNHEDFNIIYEDDRVILCDSNSNKIGILHDFQVLLSLFHENDSLTGEMLYDFVIQETELLNLKCNYPLVRENVLKIIYWFLSSKCLRVFDLKEYNDKLRIAEKEMVS